MGDYGGLAALITAIAVLVAAISGAYVSIRTTRTVKETHAKVAQIDAAVNGKRPGETTMVSQVQDLHDQLPAKQEAILPMLKRLIADVDELKHRAKGTS